MEGNAIAVLPGGHDGRDDELTIWVSTQMPHGFRDQAAQSSASTPSRCA